jgi:hypothetical protein
VRNFTLSNTPRRPGAVLLAMIGCAVFLAMFFAGARTAQAGVEVDNAIMLDPFDPVPEIQFNHYGGYAWGYGTYHHYGHECRWHCRYRHHEDWRDHDAGDDAWERYDEQSERYDRQSCWYQHEYIGGHCREHHGDHDGHDGHGDWDDHHGDHHDGDRHDDDKYHHGDDGHHHHDGDDGDWHGDHHDHGDADDNDDDGNDDN